MPRLTVPVMLEIERILDNKPIRPPMISTLQMRGLISHGKYFIIAKIKIKSQKILIKNFFFKNALLYPKVGPPPEIVEN